jgi:rubrerythrin
MDEEDIVVSSRDADFRDEFEDLEKGIAKEKDCLGFYRETLPKISDPKVRELYEWLVAYEEAHIAELEATSSDVSHDGAWRGGLDERLQRAVESIGQIPQPPEQGGDPDRNALLSVRQAIYLLKELASVYFTALRRARNDDARVLWRHLSEKVGAQKDVLEAWFSSLLSNATAKAS